MAKKFAAAACAVGIAALTAGSALAGEVKGPPGGGGGATPIASGAAASECAFNGLNDFQQGQTERITQNYGTNIQLGLDPAVFGFPGTGCNPTRA
jgi:hypothetical protein